MDPERAAAERAAWAEIHKIEDHFQLPRTLVRAVQVAAKPVGLGLILLVVVAFFLLLAGQASNDRATRVPNFAPIELSPCRSCAYNPVHTP